MLRPASLGTPPTLAGTVERVAFQGTHQNIEVRTPAGALLVREAGEFRIDDRVDVTWKSADVRLLREP